MTRQIPKRVPQDPPYWLDFLSPNLLLAPVEVTLTTIQHGERSVEVEIQQARQSLINLAKIDLDNEDLVWSGGGEFASFVYTFLGGDPPNKIEMGEIALRYTVDMTGGDLQHLWPFVRDLRIEMEWEEVEDIEPLGIRISAEDYRIHLEVLQEVAFVYLPSEWQPSITVTLTIGKNSPRDNLDLDLTLVSHKIKPTAEIHFHRVTSQEEFNWIWDPDWMDKDATIEVQDEGQAPISTPVFPLVRDGTVL